MTHVVTLGVGESIQIGDEITVTVLDTQKGGHRTRLKIDQKPRFEIRRVAALAAVGVDGETTAPQRASGG